jgi:hypothetical protein
MNIKTYLYQRRVKRLKRKIAGLKSKIEYVSGCKWMNERNEQIAKPTHHFDLILDWTSSKAELEEELNQLVNG